MTRPGPAFSPPGLQRDQVNIFGRVAYASARRASWVIAAYVLIASIALAYAIARLEVNTDPGQMISRTLDFRKAFADYTRTFPELDTTFVVVVDSKQPELGREAARSLAQSFAARPDLFQNVYSPGTSRFFDTYGLLYRSTDEVRNAVAEIGQAAPLFKTLAERPNLIGLTALFDNLEQAAKAGALPKSLEPLLSEMARTATAELSGQPQPLDWSKLGGAAKAGDSRWYVVVKPRLDFSQLDPAEAAMREARHIVADPEIERSGRVTARLTGEAAVNAEEFEAVIRGASVAGLASFCLVVTVIGFGLPALRLIVPALAMLVLGFMVTAGFATATVGHLNMISVAFAVLFIGLGVDYAIHILLRYAELAREGTGRIAAIVASASGTGPALGVCTLTTSMAFLAFTPTDFVGMAQLGIIAAGGIVVAFVASLTLIPAVLSIIPRPAAWHRNTVPLWAVSASEPARRSLPRIAVTVIVFAASAAAAFVVPSVVFDGDPINLKDPNSAAVSAFKDLLKKEPGTVYAVQVLADDQTEAHTLAKSLLALPSVKSVRSVSDLLPDDQPVKLAVLRALKGAIPARANPVPPTNAATLRANFDKLKRQIESIKNAEATEATTRIAATVLLDSLNRLDDPEPLDNARLGRLEQAMFARLPEMIERMSRLAEAEPIGIDTLDPQIRSRYIAADGRWRLEVTPRDDLGDEKNLRIFASQVRSVTSKATGAPVEITGGADVVSAAIMIASLSALGLVVLVLLPILRRPVDVLLIIAPIALAALLLCGYTVLFESPFNFANVIVLPLLLGLGVDSSIHYVMRAREDRGNHDVTITSTPRAVLISALTTIGSFGTLWLSPHLGMSSMGELLTVAIFISLICTLIVLPQLISWTIGRHNLQDHR
ncbi:MAG: MMPL family transporter [Rhizobiales bacterium]|nr:MMPL family transporter [Hyphomicrobiales bacterium]